MIKAFGIIRLVYAAFMLVLSLLIFIKAPTDFFWKVTILVTEFGWALIFFTLLVFIPGWRATRWGRISLGVGVAAVILYLTPIFQALGINDVLPRQFYAVFGESNLDETPFSVVRQWGLKDTVSPTEHEYRRIEGESLVMDVYTDTEAPRNRPCVVVIHGGAWRGGDQNQLPDLNSFLAKRGYTVAAITYRLAPDSPFPAALDDVRQAVEFLKTNKDDFGIDPNRIFLLGRSAGAHLALLAAYAQRDLDIRGVISFYGPADLFYGYQNPANPRVIDSRGVLVDFLAGTPDQVRETYRVASPIEHVSAFSPPTLLIHGRRDELVSVEQSRRLDQKLSDAGVMHLYLEMPGLPMDAIMFSTVRADS